MTEGIQERPRIDPNPYYKFLNPRAATLQEIEAAKMQKTRTGKDTNLAKLREKYALSNLEDQTEETETADAQKLADLRMKLSNLSRTNQSNE